MKPNGSAGAASQSAKGKGDQVPADQRAGDAPAGPEGGKVASVVSFCSDSLECCALLWRIKDMDKELDRHLVPELLEMRNWLVSLHNKYATGERECSRCRAPGGRLDPQRKKATPEGGAG